MRSLLLFTTIFFIGMLPGMRRRARANLRLAFGPAGPRLYYRGLIRLAENIRFVLQAGRRNRARRPQVRFVSAELISSIPIPPPWVCVSGHVGAFELMSQIAGDLHTKLAVVVRPPRNWFFRNILALVRRRLGIETIEKGDVLRKSFEAMRSGKSVAVMADHNAGYQGVFVPFLGFLASTTRLPAVLALRFKKPIVMGFIRKEGSELVAWIEKVIYPNVSADPRQEERRILGEMNDAFTDVIRRYPEEWFWFHQRWKTRPGDREAHILR